MLESGEVDAVLLTGYFGGYSQYSEEFAGLEADVAREVARAVEVTGRPLVAQTMYADSPTAAVLRAGSVPVYPSIESAVAALAALLPRRPAHGSPELPAERQLPAVDGYFGARALLEAAGIEFVARPERFRRGDVAEAASELGYPVVVKALGTLHKSDACGVSSASPARRSCLRRSPTCGPARPARFSVERMAPLHDGVELIVGARRDPRFGPVAAGRPRWDPHRGLRRLRWASPRSTSREAERAARSLRARRCWRGARGRRPCDVHAAAGAAVAPSRVPAAHPDIAEIEINPLLVTPDGASPWTRA